MIKWSRKERFSENKFWSFSVYGDSDAVEKIKECRFKEPSKSKKLSIKHILEEIERIVSEKMSSNRRICPYL